MNASAALAISNYGVSRFYHANELISSRRIDNEEAHMVSECLNPLMPPCRVFSGPNTADILRTEQLYIYRHCLHYMRSRLYVTALRLSVRPSVCPVATAEQQL